MDALHDAVSAAHRMKRTYVVVVFGRDNGDLLRSAILSRGGSKDPMELHRDFRGQDPDVQALMIRRVLR